MWEARAEVEQSTSIAKDLAPERKLQGIFVGVMDWTLIVLLAAALRTVGHPPAEDSGYDDHHDGEGVEGDGFGPGVDSAWWEIFWGDIFI